MLHSLIHPLIPPFLFPTHSKYFLISILLKFPLPFFLPLFQKTTHALFLHVHHYSLFLPHYSYHSHLDAHMTPLCHNNVLLWIPPHLTFFLILHHLPQFLYLILWILVLLELPLLTVLSFHCFIMTAVFLLFSLPQTHTLH